MTPFLLVRNCLLVPLFAALTLVAGCATDKPTTPNDVATPSVAAPGGREAIRAADAATAPPATPAPAAASETAPAPAEPVKVRPEQLLVEGRDSYNKGDYKNAIRKLQSASDTAMAASPTQKDSLKYLAFSLCVSNQRVTCKARFVQLLKLDPRFELTRAEAGHPLWGPVFRDAKASVKPAAAPQKKAS